MARGQTEKHKQAETQANKHITQNDRQILRQTDTQNKQTNRDKNATTDGSTGWLEHSHKGRRLTDKAETSRQTDRKSPLEQKI